MWSRPFSDLIPGLARRDQLGVEAYWNLATTPNSTATPGIQFIFNPSFNQTVAFIAVPQLKFRVLF